MILRGVFGFIIILVLLFVPIFVFADTVTLKSGSIIEGDILEETDDYIKMNYQGNTVYYKRKYIKNIEKGETRPALQEGAKVEEAVLEDPNSYLKKGFQYASEEKFDQAQVQFEKGLQILPSHYNLNEALKLTQQVKEGKIGKDYALCLFKGSSYLMNAQYKEAISEFKKGLKTTPQDKDLNYYLGISSYSLGECQQAIDYLQKALGTQLDDEVYYYLGVSYYSLGRVSEAAKYINKALEIDPDDADAHSILGVCSHLMGNPEKARYHLGKSIELFKKEGDYLKAIEVEEFLGKLN